MNDFFNLMSFGCACAYALTMISVMRIRKKYPQWVSPYKLKGGNITRILALLIAIMIAFFCTLGQSAGSWKAFGIYLGRSLCCGVDGSGKLEETSGRNRNSRRSGEVLGFNLFKTHAGSTAWHKLFQCKGEM